MVPEKHYYPYVERFFRKGLGCFATQTTTGPTGVGYADVLGVRDIGGTLAGDVELIAAEVKLTTYHFGKLLGQALGYSLFTNKCYLAVPMEKSKAFSAEERELATRLGVGLIEIRGKKALQCVETLAPQFREPVNALALRALYLLDYFRCAICGGVTHAGSTQFTTKATTAIEKSKMLYFRRQIRDGKRIRDLMFSRRDIKRMEKETYVCHACLTRITHSVIG